MSSEDTVPINTNLPMNLHPANMSGAAPKLTHALTTAYRVWSEIEASDAEFLAEAKGTRPKPPGRKMTEVEARFYDRDVEEWARRTSAFRKELAKKAQPRIEKASKTLLEAIASAQGQIDTLEAQIQHKLAPHPPTGSIHTEVRERLGKKPTLPTLQKFVESGDPIIIGTIIGSHPLLLGVDEKSHDIMKQLAMKRYTPKEKEQLEAVRRDLERFEQARKTFVEGVTKKLAVLDSKEVDILESFGEAS